MSLLLLFFLLAAASWFPIGIPAHSSSDLSVYEVLEEYDFPVGILPQGITSYELNSTTGEFKVYLNSTCTFNIYSYKLKYKKTITGIISTDEIKSLEGISVFAVLFWLNIEKVTRVGDEIDFSVGIVSSDFAVDNFSESPQCGCGFDCVNLRGNTNKSKSKSKSKSYALSTF